MPNVSASQKRVFGNGFVFSGSWGDAGAPGFGLTADMVSSVAKAIPGCAVTVEHAGLKEVCTIIGNRRLPIDQKNFLDEIDRLKGKKRSIGKVIGSNNADIVIRVNPQFSATAQLMRRGLLTGLSLTTVSDASGVRPIEVTLTTDPARGLMAKLHAEYKGTERTPINSLTMSSIAGETSAPAAEPTPEVTPLEAAVSNLSEDQRTEVLKRFDEYETRIKDLNDNKTNLEAENTKMAKVVEFKDADKEILESQLESLLTKIHELTGYNRAKEVQEMLKHDDLSIRNHGLTQMVAACSKAFDVFEVPAAPAAQPAAKRPRTESAASPDVRNLLRASFD